MKQFVLLVLSLFSATNAHLLGPVPIRAHSRYKRDAVGALDIVTNNAQPIHAEVKNENLAPDVETTTVLVTQELHGEVKAEALTSSSANTTTSGATEKPCPMPYVPAAIEMGTVFQVTPPKDVSRVELDYPVRLKSGRKSWPLTNRLNLIRSVSRLTTLVVLIISAAVELYPLVCHIIELYK